MNIEQGRGTGREEKQGRKGGTGKEGEEQGRGGTGKGE